MATSDGIPQRDLILGFTRASSIGAPGMVLMSKFAPPATTFTQADMAGPWRVYMERVESKLAGSTWEIGLTNFSAGGAFTGGTLTDEVGTATVLTTGGLVVAANGSVDGTLTAGSGATAHRYEIHGTMRGLKDIVTGVVTAQLGTASTYQGIVTLVREVSVLDFGQPTYTVVEGQPAKVTVLRTGNQASAVTVDYAAGGGTAPPGDYAVLGSGTLTFPANASSRTFDVATTNDGMVQGSRTVNLSISDPGGSAVLGSQTTATLTIQDNDVGGIVKFSSPAVSVLEGDSAVLTLTRTGGTGGNVSVVYGTSDITATGGTDYAASAGLVVFGPGETTKQISISTTTDGIVEGDETFRVTLSSPLGLTIGTPSSATVTILDAQQGFQFGAAEYTVNEGMAAAVTVVRTGPASAPATVRYATSPGSATPGADYTPVTGVLTFAANARTATFMVPTLQDVLAEGPETVLLTLSDPSPPAQLGPRRTAALTIVDNDVPGVVKLGAAAYTVAEGAKTVLVTVQRTGNADGVTVSYATTPGTATPGQDYLSVSGTLTFRATETTKTIAITILNDVLDEPAETFMIALSNPGGGLTLGSPSSAVVTITDDDLPGVVAIGTPAVSVGESAGNATVTITRTGGMAGGVTVDFATADGSAQAGSDYTARSGRLTFNAGETSKPVTIAILGDTTREGDETFTLVLSNPGGGATLGTARVATVTIRDDETGPTVQFGAAAYSVVESAAKAVVTVTRTGSTLAGQSVMVRTNITGTAPSNQFTAVNQLVTFAAGQASATVDVPLTALANNTAVDGDRTVGLELANPFSPSGTLSLGAPRLAVLTIRDDDSQFRFSGTSYLTIEGAPATLTVQRLGAAITPATVKFATVNGLAVAPGQYAAKNGTLVFAPGVTSQIITITTVNDAVQRGDADFSVVLSDAVGAALGTPSTATVEIQENDGNGTVRFSAVAYSVLEGAPATISVTRSGGTAGPLTVGYATVAGGTAIGGAAPGPGVDYVTRSGTLTFAAGATTQTFMVTTVADAVVEGAKTVNLALNVPAGSGAVLGSPSTAVLTIVDDEQPRFQFMTPTVTVSEGAGVANLTVMRVGPTTGTYTVGYTLAGVTATAGADFVAAGGTLTFGPGITSRPISVPIVADTLNEPAETFTVTLSGPSAGAVLGTPSVATVTITDDDPAGAVQFAASNYAVTEGGAVTLTVTRTGTAGPVTVAFATSPGTAVASDYVAQSGTLTFAAGETARTLTVTAASDISLEGPEFLEVVLSSPGGGLVLGTPARARVWIVDAQQSLQFSASSYAVVEGSAAMVTVTRTGAPSNAASATITLGGAAVAGIDYVVPASLVLNFPSGVTSQTLIIQTQPNTVAEGARVLTLGLTGMSGAVAGSPGAATLTIIDNERPDLTVTSVSGPAQAATGIPTTVTAVVHNLAAGAAPASKLGVFLSPSSSTPGAGVRVALVDVPPLAALATATVNAAVTIPGNVSTGSYFLSVVADATGLIAEENEGNNGLTAAAQVAVVLFLPDLVVATVQPPGNTLSGKLVSAPLQVRNAGLVASGPYRVGVYLSTDPTPGTGTLVATRDMPALAAGAGADVPVSIAVPDDLPQGAYFMSGVVDLEGTVAEASEVNNALASAVPFQVTRNLTKLTSFSASFSIASAGGCGLPTQTLNLAGTLTLASQTGTTGQGTLTLSGPVLGGGTVTFRGPYSAIVNLDETVTVAFTATVTGAFTGTATLTASGSIAGGGTLTATITSGTLNLIAPVIGTCPFGGTLTAAGEPVFFFSLLHYVFGGGFDGMTTPSPSFPLPITELSLGLTALFDPLTPVAPSTVTFTGPAGSGITSVAAERRQKTVAGYFYESDTMLSAGRTLIGNWSVRYRGATETFTVPNPDTTTRFVAMLPTVTLNAAQTHVTAISWIYKDRTTGATVPAPAYADAIQIEFNGFGIDYASPDFPRTVTSHTLPTPLPVANLNVLYISFKDAVTGHFYVTTYTQ